MSKFKTGRTLMTRGIAEEIAQNRKFAEFVRTSFLRHISGDWGDLTDSDKRANEAALKEEDRILSAYDENDWKIYIITEWDRSYTTIMFPEEY